MTQLPVLSKYSRAEASFARVHSGRAPEPSPGLAPLWKDLLAGLLLVLWIAAVLVLF